MQHRIALYVTAFGLLGTACKSSGDPTGNPPPGSQNPPAVASVSLNQTSASLTVPQTVQLTATLRDASGTVLSGRTVTWSTSAGSIATVSSNGLVTGVAPGTAKITASSEGKSAEATITVSQPAVNSVELTIPDATLEVGQTTTVVAVAKSSTGTTLPGKAFTWTTSQASVATVSVAGVVTALSPGETLISATTEGKSASGTITVVAVPVASVELSQTAASIVVGATTTLTATPRAANNSALTDRTVTWTTGNPAIATVADGVVTGVAPGVTTVTATSEGKTADATITVTPVPVATVELSPASVPLFVGDNATLTATPRDANGNELTGRAITWSSSAPAIATVAGGLVTAVAPGVTTITATSEGKEGTAVITVSSPPVVTDGRRAVGAGMEQTCALDTMRKAWCWGRGVNGNLGNGTNAEESLTATSVSGDRTYTGIASGHSHSCAIDDGGNGWCWGKGALGALGNGSVDDQNIPVMVSGGRQYTQIAISGFGSLSCGIATTGLAYCWGSNSGGGVGVGSAAAGFSVPQAVSGNRQFRQIAVAVSTACALQPDGTPWCWGSGSSGQLGNGAFTASSVPVAVSGDHRFIELAAGFGHFCGMKADDSIWCWGFNSLGQLGDGTTTNRAVPTRMLGDLVFESLALGGGGVRTCGLTAAGAAYCWGGATLGDGSTGNSSTPVAVSGGHMFLQLSGGVNSNCGVTADGVYCWGGNFYGNIGNNTRTNVLVPTKVIGMP